jgi:LacI family transcriptional regulator
MSASIRNIAREAGISHAVVSRLLRGDPALRISQQRRAEIFEVRDRLGGVKVRPSKLSHTIFSPISDSVPRAYIQRNILENPTYRAFGRELENQGYRLQVEAVAEEEMAGRVREWLGSPEHPDGLLIQTSYCTEELAGLLRTYAFPHVSNDLTREHLQINTVCHHATAGMRQAVEHLAGLGHRRLAFIGPKAFYRYPIMVSAMTALELAVDADANCWIEGVRYPEDQEHIRHHARKAFEAWRKRNPRVTALICSNDHVALGVVDAMRRLGLTPGRELSLVGYDNIEGQNASWSGRPIMTTINNPFERIGRRMADLLLNQILHGQTQIINERVPVSLVVRETTGPVLLKERSE